MATKLRFGTKERIDYRSGRHVIIRRTAMSYERIMQLAADHIHAVHMRRNEQFRLVKQGRK